MLKLTDQFAYQCSVAVQSAYKAPQHTIEHTQFSVLPVTSQGRTWRVCAIQGTEFKDIRDHAANFDLEQVMVGEGIGIHGGCFEQAFRIVNSGLVSKIDAWTGHSAGGSIAQAAAALTNIPCVSFAAFRAGNKAFARYVEGIGHRRFIKRGDYVDNLVKRWMPVCWFPLPLVRLSIPYKWNRFAHPQPCTEIGERGPWYRLLVGRTSHTMQEYVDDMRELAG